MRILVTGGAGYIGGTVAELLMQNGHEAVIYDNLCHAHRALIPAKATFLEGDLADRASLDAAFQSYAFDGVMHFAALIEAGESMKSPEVYFRNNTASTLTLLEVMLAHKVKKFVFSSTAAVYGEPKTTPIEEDAPLCPTNAYGESKLLVEQMLTWLNRIHGFRYASLRYFNVAGAIEGRGEAHEPESHLIPLVLDVALGRRPNIKVFGTDYPTPDGTCIRDYIHVWDLARAHLLAFNALAERDRLIYNLGNGHGFSIREVIEAARRVTGHPIPVEEAQRRPGDPAILIASSEKIGRELGWKPEFASLDSILASAWKWHQQRYQLTATS
ncbi:UDP-glucose 4-epimerase GalE [Pseudacidobacterium ailaaui]|uniref:UDP-glucose 4-epimerase GalE n=1 Tax=Pseudacidobacterium ailaaui TaxID=1382359 RepID=UPI0004789888|nr:UDP-glucose 4-epimerase GalE [Pseudacidobacterium ailaaui]